MAPRTFATEEFTGIRVAFPTSWADRLLEVARAELAAQLRFVDDAEEPAHVLERWLAGKQTIPMPGPRAEPGDLLVKLARAEQWVLTVEGWRELAPIELQADPAGMDAGVPSDGQRFRECGPRDEADFDQRFARRIGERGAAPNVREPAMGAGGACGRHGVYDGRGCPGCRAEQLANAAMQEAAERNAEKVVGAPRYFGRSVVEDVLDHARLEREGFIPEVQKTLDELLQHAGVLNGIADALIGDDEGANDSPFFDSVVAAQTFARALEYARQRLLTHATDAWIESRR